jgi:hypothetical protein
MNFIEGLLSYNHYIMILVVGNRLSKYAHFMALMHPYIASKVSQVFSQNVIKLYGLSKGDMTNQDPIFTNSCLFR